VQWAGRRRFSSPMPNRGSRETERAVRSAVVPAETSVLIDPLHPGRDRIEIAGPIDPEVGERLRCNKIPLPHARMPAPHADRVGATANRGEKVARHPAASGRSATAASVSAG